MQENISDPENQSNLFETVRVFKLILGITAKSLLCYKKILIIPISYEENWINKLNLLIIESLHM